MININIGWKVGRIMSKEIDNNLPKSRKEALEQNTKYYFTGKPCKWGHISVRYTRSSECKACRDEYFAREDVKEMKKAYQIENNNTEKRKQYMKEYMRKYREEKPEIVSKAIDNYLKKKKNGTTQKEK